MKNTDLPSFTKEFEHPEMKGSMVGGKDYGEIITPVSGPNKPLQVEGGPQVHEPSGTPVPYFQYKPSYMGEGNAELQGKEIKDIPLNDLERGPAHIGH